MRLQFRQFLEGAIYAFFRREDFIDVLRWHAVSHQSELEIVSSAFPHPALTWKFLDIPKIFPAFGCFFQLVSIVGEYSGPNESTNAALMNRFRDEVALLAEFARIQR